MPKSALSSLALLLAMLASCVPTTRALALQQALSPVAIQLITPNQMRAQVIAIFFVISVFCAIAFGATSIALVTDYVFQDDNDLRYSLAIVTAITMSAAAISLALGMKPYRQSLTRAGAWSRASD